MRLSAPILTVAGTVAGVAAAVLAFQSGAGGAGATSTSTTPPPATASVQPKPEVRTKFRPCEKGTKLKHGVCVRVRKQVVVVTDPVPRTQPAPVTGLEATEEHEVLPVREEGSRAGSDDEAEGARPAASREHADEEADDEHETEHGDDEAEHETEHGDDEVEHEVEHQVEHQD